MTRCGDGPRAAGRAAGAVAQFGMQAGRQAGRQAGGVRAGRKLAGGVPGRRQRAAGVAAAALLALSAPACDEPQAPDASPTLFIAIAAGDGQRGSIAQALPDSAVVVVTDRSGQAQAGVRVEWRAIEGGGSVSEPATTTDAAGRTSVEWTLGEDVGQQLLLASVRESPGITFRAEATLNYLALSAGRRHTCGVGGAGHVFCWGDDRWEQLGNGGAGGGPGAARLAGGYRLAMVAAGDQHSCGLTAAGVALCWGENSSGQLGDGTQARRTSPVEVLGGHRFTSLDVGGTHSCGVTEAGDLYCWGGSASDQLGVPVGNCTIDTLVVPCATSPVRVPLAEAALAVTAGYSHSCALGVSGRAYCWGSNAWGETGVDRESGSVVQPEAVSGGMTFRAIAGGLLNTCAVASDGRGYCWGMSRGGLLGTGDPWNWSSPRPVSGDVRFLTIGLGDDHGCGLSEQGEAWCWGRLTGDPAVTASSAPVRVAGGHVFSRLAVGGTHVCGVAVDGTWCWGSNAQGQAGVSPPGGSLAQPTRMTEGLP